MTFSKSIRFLATLLTLWFLSAMQTSAQSPNWEWAKGIGSSGDDAGTSMVVDGVGNVYVTGYFDGVTDFDPDTANTVFLTPAGGSDIFLAKFSPDGSLQWVRQMGGTGHEYGSGIDLDPAGNIWITGSFENVADFDPGPSTFWLNPGNNGSVFYVKTDANGNFIWAGFIGVWLQGPRMTIVTDASGNLYATASFFGTTDLDPGSGITTVSSTGFIDTYIIKLEPSGSLVWWKRFGDTGSCTSMDITLDAINNIYVGGVFDGSIDFDPGTAIHLEQSAVSNSNGFLVKLDSTGDYTWSRMFTGPQLNILQNVDIDPAGNVFVAGSFEGTADLNPGMGYHVATSNGDQDVFLVKLNNSGAFAWAKAFGGTGKDEVRSLTLDVTGNAYLFGNFMDSVDFFPGPGIDMIACQGGQDVFAWKCDNNGNYIWAATGGGNEWDGSCDLAVGGSDYVYITGGFRGASACFGPFCLGNNGPPQTTLEIYVARIDQLFTGTEFAEHVPAMELFPNPASSFFSCKLPRFCDVITITMYDISGRMVSFTEARQVNQFDIPVSGIAPGIYTVIVQTETFNEAVKLLVTSGL